MVLPSRSLRPSSTISLAQSQHPCVNELGPDKFIANVKQIGRRLRRSGGFEERLQLRVRGGNDRFSSLRSGKKIKKKVSRKVKLRSVTVL